MADNDLLAQAQEIQRQALLKQAQDIQSQKLGPQQGDANIIGARYNNVGTQYPMHGGAASLQTPNDVEPDRAEAFKQGVAGGLSMNYITPDKSLAQKYPGAINTGKVIGTALPAFLTGGALQAAGKAIPAVAGASEAIGGMTGVGGALSRIGVSALQAGTQGAVMGAVSKPDEGQTRLQNATDQGLAGLVGGAIFQAAAETGGAIKGAAKAFADKEAFKSLNPSKTRQVQNIIQAGKAGEIGDTLRETGVVGGIPTTRSGIAQRANEAVEQVGEKLGEKIDQIAAHADSLVGPTTGKEITNPLVSAPQPKVGIDRAAIADHLEQELLQDHAGIPTLEDKFSKIQKLIDRFKEGGSSFLSIKDAQKAKVALGKGINWNRPPHVDIPENEVFDRALYHTLSSGIEDAADHASQQMGPEFADEYRTLKQQYGNLKSAAAIANKASVGEYTNRFISPSDYGVGMFSSLLSASSPQAALGHAVMGAVANKTARTFGNQIFSGMGQSVSDAAGGLGGMSSYIPQISNMEPVNSTISNMILPQSAIQRRLQKKSQ